MNSLSQSKILSKPIIALVLTMLLWGNAFTLTKVALVSYDPIVVMLVRLVVASLFFLTLKNRFGQISYQKGDWKLILLMVLFEPFLYFLCETHALQLTSSAAAATIVALLPIGIAVAAYYMFSEQITLKIWSGLFLTVVGTLILTVFGTENKTAPNPVLGNILEFLALFCAIGYTLTVKFLTDRYSEFFLTAIQVLFGSCLFFPLLFLPSTDLPTEFSWIVSLTLLHLGAIESGLAYLFYNYALSELPASQVAMFFSIMPIFAALSGLLVLDETINLWQVAGMVIVISGLIYSSSDIRETSKIE